MLITKRKGLVVVENVILLVTVTVAADIYKYNGISSIKTIRNSNSLTIFI
jgi:hypothetical protein